MANLGYIQITRICNQKCLFCSNPANGRVIDFHEAKEAVDDYIARGYQGIIWTGGEPTLYPRLAELIAYAKERGIHSRIITNGQKMADLKYFKKLVDSGLEHVNISFFSHKPKIQNFLAQKSDSYRHIIKTLHNAQKIGVITHVNTVINTYNADHLSDIVKFVVKKYPVVNHFIWNNIDPLMNRASKNVNTIPTLNDFEPELFKAMKFLDENGKTFRVERVPLCYMLEYAYRSTETRKIVKNEERIVHYLDDTKGVLRQTQWAYRKAECCAICTVKDICAGLWQMDVYYSSKELYPVFVDSDTIRKQIVDDND